VGPRPLADFGGEPCADGVLDHVVAGQAEIGLAVDDTSSETVGEQATEPVVARVELLRVAAE
jgi:hypothetical protein